jgi:hypothetical protein
VARLLGLSEPPAADAADALAVALCHGRRGGNVTRTTTGARDWKSFVEANPSRVRGR